MKTLVVFYSRSGRTRALALQIAERLGADVEELRTRRSYRGFLGLWRSVGDAIKRVEFAIEPPAKRIQDYDVVVLGAPIWGGRLAAPMLTYLAQAKGTMRKAALFATSGGALAPNVLEETAQSAGATFLGGLAVDRYQLKDADLSSRIDRFVEAVASHDPEKIS